MTDRDSTTRTRARPPSAPLAGTSRLRRKAAYPQCLRCAGAPRRPASGSRLSLTILAWHAALYDPGEFDHRYGPVLRCRHGLRRDLSGSALPKFPQSASRGARLSGLPDSLTLRPARLLAPLRRIEPGLPGPRGLLLPGFRQFGHPPCRWVSLQHGLDSLCWRDLHPLEWQLASLHQIKTVEAARDALLAVGQTGKPAPAAMLLEITGIGP